MRRPRITYAVLSCQSHRSGCPFEYDGRCTHPRKPADVGYVSGRYHSVPQWCPLRANSVIVRLGDGYVLVEPKREPQFTTSSEPYGPKEEQRSWSELPAKDKESL